MIVFKKMSEKKIALITGSTSGIGYGIAKSLAQNNYSIILNGFGSRKLINLLIKEITNFGVECSYINADVSKPGQVKNMVQKVVKKFKSIDILINNAGIQHIATVEKFSVEKWNHIISTNLSSVFFGIKYTLPYMKKKKWGRIINIASVHGLVASTNKAAYVASKHGVIGLTKAVALETAETNITCNAICPGWVYTPLVEAQITKLSKKLKKSIKQIKKQLLAEKHPSKKSINIEDIGSLVNYLCSKEASNIRGATWTIDGGWSAQ